MCEEVRKLCKIKVSSVYCLTVCSCVCPRLYCSLSVHLNVMRGEMGDLSLSEQWRLLVGEEVER